MQTEIEKNGTQSTKSVLLSIIKLLSQALSSIGVDYFKIYKVEGGNTQFSISESKGQHLSYDFNTYAPNLKLQKSNSFYTPSRCKSLAICLIK